DSFHVLLSVVLFFFFQAEDGIRDKLVTGVQTCALPISMAACVDGCGSWRRQITWTAIGGASRSGRKTTPSRRYWAVVPSGVMPRSEERRVGEEGRARGWAEREKENKHVAEQRNKRENQQ